MPITTIFFDAGGTLVFPDVDLTYAALGARGIYPSQQQLEAAERESKLQLDDARSKNHSVDAQYWDMYYGSLLRQLGMADDIELRAMLVGATRKSTNWQRVLPGTYDLLDRMKRRYRIGLISNSDGSVEQLFQLLGLADYFDSFTDSCRCGFEKPDPRIFQAALRSLSTKPEFSVYVGDIYSIDFVGAKAVGMQAVLMDVAGVYRNTPHLRAESLSELEFRLVIE
jgi:putative hydrolase of the HAD superfamily